MNLSRVVTRAAAALAYRAARVLAPGVYAQDGLVSVHNHDFLADPMFRRAYQRGMRALDGRDGYRWHWRIHVALWAATSAAKLPGDYVECGVNRGFLSSAIMEALDWDRLERTFWLLDTFAGLDERFASRQERVRNREELESGFYVRSVDGVIANFAQWKNVRVVVGSVPDTLPQVTASRIAYLHLDMNCAPPEVAAAEHFWDRLTPGAPVLLDDYAYKGFAPQKAAMDAFAARKDVTICSLPTGQGLMLKPPTASALADSERSDTQVRLPR